MQVGKVLVDKDNKQVACPVDSVPLVACQASLQLEAEVDKDPHSDLAEVVSHIVYIIS